MTRLTGLRRSLLPAAAELETAQRDTARVSTAPPHTASGPTAEVPMTAVDRRRVRRRLRTPDGTELRLAFPTGTVLTPGTVLGTGLDTRGGVTYVVSAAPEDVAAVWPRTLGEAAKVAHAVGNLHRDFVEDAGAFLVLWDAPVELLLTRLGVPFARERRPFHGRPSWEHEG